MLSRTPTLVKNIHNHHQLQQKLQKCHPSLTGFLMPSYSTDFNQILNRASSEHMQTIQNVIKDNSPSQKNQKHLQQQLKRQNSLREFLMPSNSSDFNQILNIAPSGHVETIQNVIKDTSPSQEHPNHHQLQPKIYKCHQS